MMYRTHIAIGLFLAFLFMPSVKFKIIFLPIILICSLLPDIDCTHSYLGKHRIFRPLQWVIKHREFLHSFTFCYLLTLLLVLYFPIFALPFFLGYGGHLFADAFTIEGIKPFWPKEEKMEGKIKTGGKIEVILFYTISIVDLLLLIRFFI